MTTTPTRTLITDSAEVIAKEIAPYGKLEKGVRKSKPKKASALAKYVWRMVRFHTGADIHMPVTAQFDLYDAAENRGMEGFYVTRTDEQKQFVREAGKLVDEVIEVFGVDGTQAARRWHRAGLI